VGTDNKFKRINHVSNFTDPFAPVELTIDYVDSVAGSRKTLTAVGKALTAAKRGARIIFSMPTHKLIEEMFGKAREIDGKVPLVEITSRNEKGVVQKICKHIEKVQNGHLLFITHEALLRVTKWPDQAKDYELYIDEVLDVILGRTPFMLRDNHWVLTNFLETAPVTGTIAQRMRERAFTSYYTRSDADRLDVVDTIINDANSTADDVSAALAEQKTLVLKKQEWQDWVTPRDDVSKEYYRIVPKYNTKTQDPLYWFKRHEFAKHQDDIYDYLDPIAKWLMQGNPLFTAAEAWEQMIMRAPKKPDDDAMLDDPEYIAAKDAYNDPYRGLITITGFMRPDMLSHFKRVTVMSALFKHTMLYQVWTQLGVEFVPSQRVAVNVPTTDLGTRKLKIYWLSDEGWSKRTRDRSGGITPILELIRDAKVLRRNQPVCVVVNKDDGDEKNPGKIKQVFKNAVIMPNNVKGQNIWIKNNQLIHCSALNSYTSDIRWVENVLGVDGDHQRICRTGHEVYQALMRLSLREPTETQDITLVVMDKDIAEWLPQWFSPNNQVSVEEIYSGSVIKKKSKRGPKPVTGKTMTGAERMRRHRLSKKRE
jgi:hypothetical protein